MLHYAVIFFVISLIAAVFGFAGIAGDAAGVSKVLFFVFLLLAVVSFIANTADYPGKPRKKSKANIKLENLARMQARFPVGRELNYLGIRMRVTGHRSWSWDDSEWWPCVCLEYAAGFNIKTHTLGLVEADALAAELEGKPPAPPANLPDGVL